MLAPDKLAARHESTRRLLRERKIAGLCESCEMPAVAPGQTCERHRRLITERRLRSTRHRLQRAADGMCMRISCPERALPGNVRCVYHRDASLAVTRTTADRRVLRGVCKKCGLMPVKRFKHCAKCRAGWSETRLERIQRRPLVA